MIGSGGRVIECGEAGIDVERSEAWGAKGSSGQGIGGE